jgi:hypothetical protein
MPVPEPITAMPVIAELVSDARRRSARCARRSTVEGTTDIDHSRLYSCQSPNSKI